MGSSCLHLVLFMQWALVALTFIQFTFNLTLSTTWCTLRFFPCINCSGWWSILIIPVNFNPICLCCPCAMLKINIKNIALVNKKNTLQKCWQQYFDTFFRFAGGRFLPFWYCGSTTATLNQHVVLLVLFAKKLLAPVLFPNLAPFYPVGLVSSKQILTVTLTYWKDWWRFSVK